MVVSEITQQLLDGWISIQVQVQAPCSKLMNCNHFGDQTPAKLMKFPPASADLCVY